jgi:6-phosphogluconolactonase
MGEDGHTASIFPDQMNLLNSPQLCEIAEHPVSKQKRITLTGAVLTHAKRVVFLVTGNKKASVVKQIMESEKSAEEYPAAWIHYHSKSVWYLDDKAAKLISK